MHDSPRRLLLRVAVKLLFLIGIGISIYILFASTGEQSPIKPTLPAPLRIPLAQMNGNTFQRLPWQGGNLLLLRRTPGELAQLGSHDEQLLNPDSVHAHQPPALPSPARSLYPELFIAFDRGTDLGCPLQWIAAGAADGAPIQPWPGGFRDSCAGSWYDAAGRVFKGQAAKRNLEIPAYRIDGELLEIGTRGDNPAPAN
jgi:ubiquinol-cytochrome c reductase iron-sulfur subunit